MQISDEVISILEYLCAKIGIAIDWTGENVLPYVEQLCEKFITWEINTSFAWIGIMGGITLLALIAAIIMNMLDACKGAAWTIFAIILVITIMVVGTQIFDIIECKAFPEKAIYDYIKILYANNR